MDIEFIPLNTMATMLGMKWDIPAKKILSSMNKDEIKLAAVALGVGIKSINGITVSEITDKLEIIRRNQ